MKKYLVVFSFLLMLVLFACSTSIETYEELLEETDWDVTLIDSEDYLENAPDGIVNVLAAEKGLWEFGYVYEFNSSSNARSFFNELKDELLEEGGAEFDIDDYLKLSGNFVFFSFSEGFFEDLELD